MSLRQIRILVIALLAVGALWAVSARVARADDGYTGPEKCQECHPGQVEAWGNAPHADASSVTAFVQAWQAANSPRYCLACHTTGYDPNTGLYAFEGVTCEACHGPFDSRHPDQPMVVDTSSQACGQCHESTLNEWELSQHGQNGIECVSCHTVHSQKMKTGTATELCSQCHADIAANVAHASSSGSGLSCADCHIGPSSGDPQEGHTSTGHTFQVGTQTCSRCHADEVHRGLTAMMGGGQSPEPTPSVAAAPATAPTGAENPATNSSGVALPLLASGAVGLGLGLGWARWSRRER